MAAHQEPLRATFGIEDADRVVTGAGGDQASVRGPGDSFDEVGMAGQRRHRGAGGQIPHEGSLIV